MPERVLERVDALIVDAREREVRQRKRSNWQLLICVIILCVGVALAVGSVFLNTALSDVRTVVHQSKQVLEETRTGNAQATCRANISGAYAALESERDNLYGQFGIQVRSDPSAANATLAKIVPLVDKLAKLPPRPAAYQAGVTIEGVAYPACG